MTGDWYRYGTTIILDDPFAGELEQQPATLLSLAGYDGILESEVPRRLVVGAGATPPPRPNKFRNPATTATMDPDPRRNAHFRMRIQNALNHPMGPRGERFHEIIFERTGLMQGGLDRDAVSAAHQLLLPGGKLVIYLKSVPQYGAAGTVHAVMSLVPSQLFRDITTKIIPGKGKNQPHVVLVATRQ
ncbi:MAG: hypothetical protein ACT4NY_03920 [Pseudonocardiales bacterium]